MGTDPDPRNNQWTTYSSADPSNSTTGMIDDYSLDTY